MSFTFEVSKVAGPEPFAGRELTALQAMSRRLDSGVEAAAANLGQLYATRVHPFVEAAHRAFDEHHGLILSPDDVWLCIAQGFAQHVDLHAEELRDRFVRHQGKAQIVVIRDAFVKGSADNDWPGVFGEFSEAIAGHIGKQRDLVVADFSTTGPVEKAASEVVLMSAMRNYFDYVVVTRCGIPQVTLLGTVDDWRAIARRAAVLAEYGLADWCNALEPVLAELVRAADRRPDIELWRSFYKFKSGSGGDSASGWINVLFPYLHAEGSDQLERNGYLQRWRDGGGPSPARFPTGLSLAPFVWQYLGEKYPMDFVAGFVALSRDLAAHTVRPAIGWAVRDAREAS